MGETKSQHRVKEKEKSIWNKKNVDRQTSNNKETERAREKKAGRAGEEKESVGLKKFCQLLRQED